MLSLKIALRYLFAKKSHRAVNVISAISLAGVAVATMAIVIVLSVFNGFSDLADRQLSRIDPGLMVVPVEGKVFENADSLAALISGIDGIAEAMPALTERALLVINDDRQMPVVFKGVDPGKASRLFDFGEIMIDGSESLDSVDVYPPVILAVGVAAQMQVNPGMTALELYVPRRIGRINPANPAAAYRSTVFSVGGVFQVDQPEYDADHILIPLSQARSLLDYRNNEASSIDIAVDGSTSDSELVLEIQERLGSGFKVLTRLQQQEQAFRMISIEKWVTFLMLIFILLIASFNVISTLSLLIIEKRDNMQTLRALGATMPMIRKIFVWEGWLITAAGGVAGIILGLILSLGQQFFGWIKLSADPSTLAISAYPVRVAPVDILLVFATIIIIGMIVSKLTLLFTRPSK